MSQKYKQYNLNNLSLTSWVHLLSLLSSMLSLLNISFLFFLWVTRSSDSIVSIILCWNGFSFTTGMTGWYLCVCLGINIGAWQWVGDCIYSGYTAQPAGTNTGMVWACSVSCAHYRRQLYWTWGKTATPITNIVAAAAVITTKNDVVILYTLCRSRFNV